MPATCSDIIKIILAIILPPLGVFLERGCGADLLINILLTCLGYIPGEYVWRSDTEISEAPRRPPVLLNVLMRPPSHLSWDLRPSLLFT
ncbi:unnamed protein product [Cutaneotrichosporon oleaginosum]